MVLKRQDKEKYFFTVGNKLRIVDPSQIYFETMARGNQRELARQKNLKKQQEAAKHQKKGDAKKRMESDAEILRQKQAAADARKEAERLEKLKAGKNELLTFPLQPYHRKLLVVITLNAFFLETTWLCETKIMN